MGDTAQCLIDVTRLSLCHKERNKQTNGKPNPNEKGTKRLEVFLFCLLTGPSSSMSCDCGCLCLSVVLTK